MSELAKSLRGTVIEKNALRILDKQTVTDQELEDYFLLDSGIKTTQISISASETRQVKQYESNVYFASIQLDLGDLASNIASTIFTAVEGGFASTTESITNYIKAKEMASKIIKDRYINSERYLRTLIREQQKLDGIK